ncbi:hypothetical protein RF11_13639 [Thelohanellus kitauei]|uniref:Uncharacterized protein n=1 Tax=Thelohanellus kitauei TaxID=669202 RepID=A0A0C2I915_THEKT|nr:hypothetical protein RF11_13639 [Thelohanellus kitauei]
MSIRGIPIKYCFFINQQDLFVRIKNTVNFTQNATSHSEMFQFNTLHPIYIYHILFCSLKTFLRIWTWVDISDDFLIFVFLSLATGRKTMKYKTNKSLNIQEKLEIVDYPNVLFLDIESQIQC